MKPLADYNAKRDLKKTPEPGGGGEERTPGAPIFVIQRHKATRLHYDLRLEMDGVLKSWAVPKGPSLDPKDKRLAMMVEDHPYAYKDFKGVIPKGNYGAGIVEIWDRGRYQPVDAKGRVVSADQFLSDLAAGSIKFKLQGRKLRGGFALVRMKGGEENAWLLIKHRDEAAVEGGYDSEEHVPKNSPINKFLQKQAERKPVLGGREGKGRASARRSAR
jgi:bifunctional non-homologous end joining protein LigD